MNPYEALNGTVTNRNFEGNRTELTRINRAPWYFYVLKLQGVKNAWRS